MRNFLEMLKVQFGEPIVIDEYSFYPIFNKETSTLSYISLQEAFRRSQSGQGKFIISEVSELGAVNSLTVINELDECVLILDGEQLRGAKQNRSINVTTLIRAKNKVIIPVSCIESGRWHGNSRVFEGKDTRTDMPSDIRSRKIEGIVKLASKDIERGFEPSYMSIQSEVWDEIHRKNLSFKVHSRTDNLSDISQSNGYKIVEKVAANVHLLDKQTGVIAFKGGIFLGMDYISSPKVFSDNFNSLLHSFLLSSLESIVHVYFNSGDVHTWLFQNLSNIHFKRSHGVDLGNNWMGQGIWNCSALEYQEEIAHFTALP